MGVAILTLPGLTRNQYRQTACDQPFKLMNHLLGVLELVHASAAGQQFVDGLRTAQKHQTRQNHLCRHQFQRLVDLVLPAVGTAAHHQPGKTTPLQRPQALADLALIEVHHRFAAGFLIAGQHQRVEGQRIGFRAGGLFFDQRTENADFRGIEPRLFGGGFLFVAHRAFPLQSKPPSLILAKQKASRVLIKHGYNRHHVLPSHHMRLP